MNMPSKLRGRLLAWESEKSPTGVDGFRALIAGNQTQTPCWIPAAAIAVGATSPLPGDIVEAQPDHAIRILTPNRRPDRSMDFHRRLQDPRRHRGLRMRAQVEAGIRRFFQNREFLETRTPLLVPCPGMETHIRPFLLQSGEALPTSPEFALKRLLVGGLEKIFQITPAFRLEPPSTTHQPEFTMLEWYRAYAGMPEIMADTEALIEALALEVHGKPEITFQGRRFSVKTPWPRLAIRELFREVAGVDLVKCATSAALAAQCRRLGIDAATDEPWDDLYFRIWLNHIEPRLPQDQAIFVYGYPESQAALSVLETHPDGSRWARRFEAYAAGIELCNAFEELTDPHEQRARFVRDMKHRTELYGETFPPTPLDEDFLKALEEGLPPSGGNALGVDRLIMLLADEPDIGYTTWLQPHSAGTITP